MPRRLTDYAGVLLDLDGTLLKHESPLPGAADLVRHLQASGTRTLVVSNTTSGPSVIAKRLKAAGIDVPEDDVLTAAAAAVDYIEHTSHKLHGRPPRIFNLGQPDLDELLADVGTLVGGAGGECDFVLAGAPANELASDDRRRLALAMLRDGADLVGVCADRVYPSRRGIEFGCGAFCAMLGYAAGVKPTYCGKPEKVFFDDALARLGRPASKDVIMIGDNLEADILGGKAAGLRTGLVLGGVARRSEVDRLPDIMRPGFVVDDLPSLLSNLG